MNFQGLADQEVSDSRKQYGSNRIDHQVKSPFLVALKDALKEPMLLLLIAASTIYFLLGELNEGFFLLGAILLVASISLYQDSRSRNALEALKSLTQPLGKVIRNGVVIEIPIEEIVLGDLMMVEEGTLIPADGIIVQSNDFSVNESVLTGESLAVNKDVSEGNNQVYQGTLVVGGLSICKVSAIGIETQLGKIGKSLEEVEEAPSPLQVQIQGFVKKMAIVGVIVFVIVWGLNFAGSHLLLDSLLKSLTLAMSILPEEIPVAFSTFMALGAWRLMKLGIVVKQTRTVETLGSATVICVDKTGTITENRMALAQVYVHALNHIEEFKEGVKEKSIQEVLRIAMFASEPIPFDPMERALHRAYEVSGLEDLRKSYSMIHEYPLSGRPPMMTHIFRNEAGETIIAAKGAPEALMQVSVLTDIEKIRIEEVVQKFSSAGFRVLAVAESNNVGMPYPQEQQTISFLFKGLVAFYDPPKSNIMNVLQAFYNAGIHVKIITGDNAATTTTIASQINFEGLKHMAGEELLSLSEQELQEQVKHVHIFTRMFPEAKLKIIQALKANQEVVAMTGDGVNDGPALKAAHIGIAMGKKGSELAKQASSLILMHDDLSSMVDAVAMGRKIYSNLKKAIQYIISIHIPIILVVFMPLVLGWVYPAIFTPLHVIFLELIMGPTCSIIYENEPIEPNLMQQRPRPFTTTFFNFHELATSLVQGLMITAGCLLIYQLAVHDGADESTTRLLVFTGLVSSNIFLTLVNRSFYYSIFRTLSYKNNLLLLMIGITIVLYLVMIFVTPITHFFGFTIPPVHDLLISVGIGCVAAVWYEGVKWIKRMQPKS